MLPHTSCNFHSSKAVISASPSPDFWSGSASESIILVLPPSEPVSSSRLPAAHEHDSTNSYALFPSLQSDEVAILNSLRELVDSGEKSLDSILATLADAALLITGASGVALAMWKDGEMVCRARSGDTAPPLGTRLNAHAGISGECLRTAATQYCPDTASHPLVDAEVCQALGVRSIVVLPLHGRQSVNGILELFAALPGKFTGHEFPVLKQLAALAERARALHPQGASPLQDSEPPLQPGERGLLAASDSLRDVLGAVAGERSSRLILWGIGAVAILLVGVGIWLGWSGPDRDQGSAPAQPSDAVAAAPRLPDNDPVWKPNPGGETLYPRGNSPAIASAVKPASKNLLISLSGNKPQPAAPRSLAPAVGTSPASIALPSSASASASAPNTSAEIAPPPSIASATSDSAPLNGVLTSTAVVPILSVPTSQGLSGGQILQRVSPVYPLQAKNLRIEGRVTLTVMVNEDGSVSDVKIVKGSPALAESAVAAVARWRFQPFLLNGKPIRRETEIKVDYKLR